MFPFHRGVIRVRHSNWCIQMYSISALYTRQLRGILRPYIKEKKKRVSLTKSISFLHSYPSVILTGLSDNQQPKAVWLNASSPLYASRASFLLAREGYPPPKELLPSGDVIHVYRNHVVIFCNNRPSELLVVESDTNHTTTYACTLLPPTWDRFRLASSRYVVLSQFLSEQHCWRFDYLNLETMKVTVGPLITKLPYHSFTVSEEGINYLSRQPIDQPMQNVIIEAYSMRK